MRALILLSFAALAACSGENLGWNPNYRAEATPYGNYLRDREAALTGKRAQPPRVVPVALPARAPTAAEIAGPTITGIIERDTTQAAANLGIVSNRRLPARATAPALDVPPPVTIVRPARTVAVAATVARWPRPNAVRGNCAAFAAPAAAQQTFLANGGPQRDPLGLDPDGDGRACAWTPAPAEPL